MIVFCVRNVTYDFQGEQYAWHICDLVQTLLTTIRANGCDRFSRDNLVALLCVARRLLYEISQSASAVESECEKVFFSNFPF